MRGGRRRMNCQAARHAQGRTWHARDRLGEGASSAKECVVGASFEATAASAGDILSP